MKRAALLLLALCAGPSFAGEARSGFRFLERPTGARQAAMGDTAVSLADDANAVLWNPAGLADARQKELSLGYARFLTDMGIGGLSYMQPLSIGGLGAAAVSQDAGPTQGYDGGDSKTASFDAKDSFFSLGWGRAVNDSLRLGADVKQVSETIAGFSASVTAVDAGALLRVPAPEGWSATLSAALRNQGGKARFASEKTSLPGSLDGGLSVQGLSNALRLALEAHRPKDGPLRYRAGGELWLHNALAVRAGFKSGQALGSGLTLGLGFRLPAFQVDYAYAPGGADFGATHHAGITLRFGGPADRAYQEGVRLAQKGEYAEAILKFEAALDGDPRHAGAVRGLRDATNKLDEQMGRELNAPKETR